MLGAFSEPFGDDLSVECVGKDFWPAPPLVERVTSLSPDRVVVVVRSGNREVPILGRKLTILVGVDRKGRLTTLEDAPQDGDASDGTLR